jgi:hypothetical protein
MVMIDFVKIRIDEPTAKHLESNPLLKYDLVVPENTGAIEKRIAKYQGLKFTLFENAGGLVTGSLHKFWHSSSNYDDFFFHELIEVIGCLESLFGIEPQKAILQNVEVGVNITDLSLPPDDIINSLVLHKGKPFSNMKNLYRQPLGKDCYHQRYGIKIYNKGKQYALKYPVLRFELKHIKMKGLNKLGIFTLADLRKPDILPALGAQLEARFDEILFIDTQLHRTKLKAVEGRKMANYHNPKYWEELYHSNHKRFQYHRKRYECILCRSLEQPVKNSVANAIRQKWQELTKIDTKTLVKLTGQQNPKLGIINTSYSRLIHTKPIQQRHCKYSGLDISNQKANSKFISEKNSDYQFAHWVRNSDSNPRNNLRRKILRPNQYPTLFDVNEYLKLSNEQKEMLKTWAGTEYEIRLN